MLGATLAGLQADRLAAHRLRARHRARSRERLAAGLALGLAAAVTLYVMIGFAPYQQTVVAAANDANPVNRWVWLAFLALALPVLWIRHAAALLLLRRSWPLLAAYAWFALTTLWALDPPIAVRRFAFYVVALVVVAAIALGTEGRRALLGVLVFAGGAVCALDLASAALVPHLAMSPLGLVGVHAQKNVAGAVTLYVLIAAACRLPQVRGAARAATLVVLGFAVLELALARSETSTIVGIGVLAGLPVLVHVLRRRRGIALAVAACGLAAVIAGAFLYLAWAGIAGRDPWAPFAHITFTRRTDVWAFTLSEVVKHPWRGAGFGSFWDIDPAIQPSLFKGYWFASPTEYTNESHDGYIDLLATTGIVGLALALVVLLRGIVQAALAVARRQGPAGLAVFHLGFLIAFALHNGLESSYFVPNTALGTLALLSLLQVASL